PLTATYLNRLSDLLFILARVANKEVGDGGTPRPATPPGRSDKTL
ncbi:hypothetical protein ACIQK5_17410, partial [Streptomyces virginiae]